VVYPARCGLSNGQVFATPSGGLPPYTFQWSNGGTDDYISQLAPGDYTVTVTDGLSNTVQATGTVQDVFQLAPVTASDAYVLQPDCQGQCVGSLQFAESILQGTAPYIYGGPVATFQDIATVNGLCAGGPMIFEVLDANGCPGTIDLSGLNIDAYPAMLTIVDVTAACDGEANGTITVVLDGAWASVLSVIHSGGQYNQVHYPAWLELYTITDLPAGEYNLVSEIPALCSFPYTAAVPEIAAPCGSISGTVFNDADQDCAQDPGEPGLPYRVLTIEPGPAYAIANEQGSYFTASGFGSFTLAQPLVDEAQICPTTAPAPFTIDAGTPDVTLDLADSSFAPLDTRVSIWASAARPGFPAFVHGTVWNASTYPSGAITLVLNYDPMLDPVTVSPAPTSASPGTVQWDLPAFEAFDFQHFSVHGNIPANINLLGTVITYSVTATDAAPEVNTANNTANLPVTITGSYDPNDKLARTSSALSSTQYFLDEDAYIDYTVRFQNTGTDTAFTVVVRDTLEMDLDPGSLEILGATHAFSPAFENGRTLVFTFNDINLPDSGTNYAASNGAVQFRVKPRNDIAIGELISNSAGIYFDFNPPVITNTSELTVEMSTSTRDVEVRELAVWPNPTEGMLRVTVKDPRHRLLRLDVLAMDGRVVLREGTFLLSEALDTRSLPSGVYLLRLQDTDGSTLQAPFIKR
jgi:Secretion system C-terminal sorting domain/SprB repeat